MGLAWYRGLCVLKRDVQNWLQDVCKIYSSLPIAQKEGEKPGARRVGHPLRWLLSWEKSHSTSLANPASPSTRQVGVLICGIPFGLEASMMGHPVPVLPPPPLLFFWKQRGAEGCSAYLASRPLRLLCMNTSMQPTLLSAVFGALPSSESLRR